MIDNDLKRHGREFQRYATNNQYEVTDQGILFPKAGVTAVGEYLYSSNGGDVSIEPNLITTEGLNHILMVAMSGTAKANPFHLAIWGANYTPAASITAASFPATANEITSGTEGYSQATRPTWTPNAATAGQIDNIGLEAQYSIVTASAIVIRGAALLSESAKGATTGVLVSITRFAQDRTQYSGDVVNLGYRLRLL